MQKRLRIAYAMINCNRRDGSARAVNEVAERMARRHQVHLFARRAEDLDLSLLRWHRMPGVPRPEIADFLTYHVLAKFRIQRETFDIVHSIGVNACAANVLTIQNIQTAKRSYLDSQARVADVSWPRKLSRRLYLDVTSRTEDRMYTARPGQEPLLFLPVSRGVEKELREHYDVGQALVRIVPNAADTDKFRPIGSAEKLCWRRAAGFADSDVILAFAGGEWSRKGLDFAIRALPKLPNLNVKLLVLGKDPEQKRFVSLAGELGVAERVVFLGFRSDIATALAASDLFLFPSWYEAFSLATIEAAACGLPIAATKINGTEDFIVPEENGVFIEHDPDQIAAALRPILEDHTMRRRMGANARRLVERCYTWDRVAELTEQAYFEYLDRALVTGSAHVNGTNPIAR
jgi:glycosyltransferase involved in cell wall biosynthesis